MMWKLRSLGLCAALGLIAAACGTATPPGQTQTAPPSTETPATASAAPATPGTTGRAPGDRTVVAPVATISVDGDPADWAAVPKLELTLEGIEGVEVPVESKQAAVQVAHDDKFVYVLFEVQDDYDWTAADAHLSGASAVMWAVQSAAGPHMGPEDEAGEGPSMGMVDLWHWELECAARTQTGGEASDPGEGNDPGNDSACNFDDEWATTPKDREDDNGTGAENSLLGMWSHTSPTTSSAGTWVFEIRRPLQTGDAQDAQFAVGQMALLALAYWDADQTPSGWKDEGHAQSSNQEWIEVTLD
ncbi:MAG TPA: ethylbenzene dehydrogenase-related protein [Candidatus Limnocylindrales bacterium]|nr:ethylbenzene dehydrogenase-related protein [Candidatus Limnocylindrales bacterium]